MNKYLIESEFNSLLQKKIRFTIESKVIKKGKLLLFTIKDFYFMFTILTDKNETRLFEIPFPFDYEKTNDGEFTLDYSLQTLSNNNPDLLFIIKQQSKKKKSKFYNSNIIITADNI